MAPFEPLPTAPQDAPLRVALVHYWLIRRRGGEAVLEAIARLFPRPDLFTNVARPGVVFGKLSTLKLTTSFIDRLPGARKAHPLFMPLMPLALEMLDLDPYDLVISSEAGPAKWVIPSPEAKHICYCHSPMRYLWDQRGIYLKKIPALLRPLALMLAHRLRQSDTLSATRVTAFVANSQFVADRIKQYYRRDATAIHPPVDVEEFEFGTPEDFYLCAGHLSSYKRLDLAIEVCNRLGRKLVIAGDGNARSLKKRAGPTVTFLGPVDRETMHRLMRTCRALIFPGVEDFGIVPVEVMASGRPVIAFARGGALETVEPCVSGVLFPEQSAESLESGVREFEQKEHLFTQQRCRASARRFDRSVFERKFTALIQAVMGS